MSHPAAPFFPLVFDALPVAVVRPVATWGDGDDAWEEGEGEEIGPLAVAATHAIKQHLPITEKDIPS